MSDKRKNNVLDRRTVLAGLTGLGVGTATFRRALAAQAAQAGAVTPEMIKQAEWVAGLELTEDERTPHGPFGAAGSWAICGAAEGRRWL